MTPQLTRPKDGNKYYNTKEYCGINPGKPNPKRMEKGLTALPNCVSYALGRFNEIGGWGKIKYLGPSAYYPFAMIGVAKKQGLKVVDHPVLGGMMVWTGGTTGEGHVAIVEKVNRASIVCSESEYYGRAFCTFNRKKGSDGNWREGCSWMGKTYKFAGCIVNPAIEKEEEVTYEEFCKYMNRYLDDRAKLPASDKFAEDALTYMKDHGYMSGTPEGNMMPKSFVTREQMAIVTRNILESDS